MGEKYKCGLSDAKFWFFIGLFTGLGADIPERPVKQIRQFGLLIMKAKS